MWFEFTGLKPLRLEVPIDGQIFTGGAGKDIFTGYRKWVERTGARVAPGWQEKVWLAIEEKYPRYVTRTLTPAPPGVSIPTAVSFVQFLARRLFDKSLVDEAEARRRASICMSCPFKQPILGCVICKDALESTIKPPVQLREGLAPPAEVPPACGQCGCYLPLKVWAPRRQLGAAEEFPFWGECWMHEPSSPESSE